MLFTVCTTIAPAIIGKTFCLDQQGQVHKDTVMNYQRAAFQTVRVNGLGHLSQWLMCLRPGLDYLVAGVSDAQSGVLVGYNSRTPGEIKKTDANFPFRHRPGVFVVDTDGGSLDGNGLRDLLWSVGLHGVSFVWWPSSSSYIYANGAPVSGLKGSHCYFLIQDVSDIPRAGDVLFKRLWLAGHGSIKISAAGALLKRSPYDMALVRPMQPIFSAGAWCGPHVNQHRGAPVHFGGSEEVFDSRARLPDLSAAERGTYDRLVHDAEAAAEPQAKPVREAQVRGTVERVRARGGACAAVARQVEAVIKGSRVELPLDWLVDLKTGATVTVRDILLSGSRYHRAVCRNPIQPEYWSGMVFTNRGRPCIHTMNGLQTTFRLGAQSDKEQLRRERIAQVLIAKTQGGPS